MKYCTKCGNPLNDEMQFCPKCGTKAVEPKVADSVNDTTASETDTPEPPSDEELPSVSLNAPIESTPDVSDSNAQCVRPKPRGCMLAVAIVCLLFSAIIGLAMLVAPENGMNLGVVGYGILSFMFFVLAKSPKDNAHILGKKRGITKVAFVLLCIGALFALIMYAAENEKKNSCKHNWKTLAKTEPTCTEAGTTAKHCTLCDKKETSDEVPATGHTWTETVKEATCTEPGERVKECSTCGHKETETIAPQHNYAETAITAPTCTAEGKAQLVCSVCGEKQDKTLPKTEHTWQEATSTELKTCTTCGTMRTSDGEVVYCDVEQFANITAEQLTAMLGKPDRTEKGNGTGSLKRPCVYYEYSNHPVLGDVSFTLVNNQVVRMQSIKDGREYPGKSILKRYGVRSTGDGFIVADTSLALRYRCPSDKVDDFWVNLIDGKTFGSLLVTYDMMYFEEWYIPFGTMKETEYQILTQKIIREFLKSPSSADFPNITEWAIMGNPYHVAVASYVDAQNGFGATIRNKFFVIYAANSQTPLHIVMDGKTLLDAGYESMQERLDKMTGNKKGKKKKKK